MPSQNFASKGKLSVYQQAQKNNLSLTEAKTKEQRKVEIFKRHLLVGEKLIVR